MKRFLLALFSVALLATNALALSGGPWDNNVPGGAYSGNPVNPANPNGTFEGSIKGKNLSGTMLFTSSPGGVAVVSSTTISHVVIMGVVVTITNVTSTTISDPGFANFFYQGMPGQASVTTSMNLGSGKITGLIEAAGQSSVVSQYLITTSNTYTLTNSFYFNGTFSAKRSDGWAANNYDGKGTVSVTTFNLPLWYADVAAHPSTANPHDLKYIAPSLLAVKVSVHKTMDGIPTLTPPTITAPSLPTITP